MTQEDFLLKDLDEGRWVQLMALADWSEENKRQVHAVGYRWMAKFHRWPGNAANRKYRWQFANKDPKTILRLRHKMPYALIRHEYMTSISVASLPLLIQRTAYSLGRWIKDGCPVEDGHGSDLLQDEYNKVFGS